MTAERRSIQYGSHLIDFRMVRRDRRTLEITVQPDMSVMVVAPAEATVEAVDAKVRKRAAWIRRQQRYFAQFLPRTPERRYLAGETHLYLGRQYRLKVEQGDREGVKLSRGFITVTTRSAERVESVKAAIDQWYRERAHLKFAERLEVNLLRFPPSERHRPKGLIVRHIQKRWGSMSAAGRLLLNLRLIEAPINAIDYVITHELCHLEEPNHGSKFFDLLSRVLPDWRQRKERLERILA